MFIGYKFLLVILNVGNLNDLNPVDPENSGWVEVVRGGRYLGWGDGWVEGNIVGRKLKIEGTRIGKAGGGESGRRGGRDGKKIDLV